MKSKRTKYVKRVPATGEDVHQILDLLEASTSEMYKVLCKIDPEMMVDMNPEMEST
jgi:hypothetical protein